MCLGMFLYQGIDTDRDWKLLLLFVQTDQLCACDQQQVTNKICCLDSPLKIHTVCVQLELKPKMASNTYICVSIKPQLLKLHIKKNK